MNDDTIAKIIEMTETLELHEAFSLGHALAMIAYVKTNEKNEELAEQVDDKEKLVNTWKRACSGTGQELDRVDRDNDILRNAVRTLEQENYNLRRKLHELESKLEDYGDLVGANQSLVSARDEANRRNAATYQMLRDKDNDISEKNEELDEWRAAATRTAIGIISMGIDGGEDRILFDALFGDGAFVAVTRAYPNKIESIKALRSKAKIGLKQTKDIVDAFYCKWDTYK